MKIIRKANEIYNTISDILAIKLLQIGTRRIRARKMTFRAGGELYTIEKYTPKHTRKTATGKAEYWKKHNKMVNAPGFGDFIVLDTFESRLP